MRMELRDKLFLMVSRWSILSTSTLHAPFGHTYHVLERRPNKENELPEGQGDTQKIKLLPGTSVMFSISGSPKKYEAREYREQRGYPYHTPGLVIMGEKGEGVKATLGPDSGEIEHPEIGRLKFMVPPENGNRRK